MYKKGFEMTDQMWVKGTHYNVHAVIFMASQVFNLWLLVGRNNRTGALRNETEKVKKNFFDRRFGFLALASLLAHTFPFH